MPAGSRRPAPGRSWRRAPSARPATDVRPARVRHPGQGPGLGAHHPGACAAGAPVRYRSSSVPEKPATGRPVTSAASRGASRRPRPAAAAPGSRGAICDPRASPLPSSRRARRSARRARSAPRRRPRARRRRSPGGRTPRRPAGPAPRRGRCRSSEQRLDELGDGRRLDPGQLARTCGGRGACDVGRRRRPRACAAAGPGPRPPRGPGRRPRDRRRAAPGRRRPTAR